MSSSLLLPSGRNNQLNLRWQITNLNHGLCTPTTSTDGTFATLEECQKWARPGNRELRWNVVNSSGYGCQGQVVGECRPTLDPYAEFSDPLECASSHRAKYQAYPDPDRPKGWICTHPTLGICMETQNINVPFTYKVYRTHQECVNAPENNLDSAVMMSGLPPYERSNNNNDTMWYIDADRNRCAPSTLSSAPFGSLQQCQTAIKQCNYAGQPSLQFSNPTQAPDAHWKEPYSGFRSDPGRNVTPFMQTPQIPLNPVDRPPVIGTQQILPGAAGQGYGVLG